jgi:elongation factor G
MEKVAEMDDVLMDNYFENGELTVEEIKKGLRIAICNNELYAVTCGSALQNIGVQMVIDAATEYLPSPMDVNEGLISVKDIDTKEETKKVPVANDESLAAIAFKVATDPFV